MYKKKHIRIARDAFLKMRALFDDKEWPIYFKAKGTKHRDTKVANTIIQMFRIGMGLSDKPEDIKKFLPLPWNYFDVCVLSIVEFAHNRIIGILGVTIGVMEDLIPNCHKKDWVLFCRGKPRCQGLPKRLNINTNPQRGRKRGRQVRKAMKIWANALLFLIDGELFGIHPDLIEFLRIHLMVASRWFSPTHSLEQHFDIRKFLFSSFMFPTLS